MAKSLKRPLSIALGALAATALGGCYYGDVYGASYASGGDCSARYGDAYYDYDGYAYDDGYGYDRSEEHTSELQSLMSNSYAVFCLKKKQKQSQPVTQSTTI